MPSVSTIHDCCFVAEMAGAYGQGQKTFPSPLQGLSAVIGILSYAQGHACICVCMTSKATQTPGGLPVYLVNIDAHLHLDCCTKHSPQKDVPAIQ